MSAMINKLTFLKSLAGLFALPFIKSPAGDIESLEENYAKAANALSDYREKSGFVPGARVRAQYRDEPPKFGVIPPYGEVWRGCEHWSVPVLLDAGYRQPWMMSDLKVIEPAPASPKLEPKEASGK